MSGRRIAPGLLVLGTGALLAAAALLTWRVETLSRDSARLPPSVSVPAVERLLDAKLKDAAGRPVYLDRSTAHYLVLFIFTLRDCFACIPELADLNRISAARHDVQVFGLLSFADDEEAKQTSRNFGLNYPLLLDPNGLALRDLGPPKTPWKLVINLQNHNLIYEDPPCVGDAERQAFLDRVLQLAP